MTPYAQPNPGATAMNAAEKASPVTLTTLQRMRENGEKIAMLTCYDAAFAALLDRAGVDVLLVGDSLGNVIQGHKTTLPVTLEQMCYHTACVARGAHRPFIVADLPFGSYQQSPEQAFASAAQLMAAGAQMVKLEGGMPMVDTVQFLVERGIPVCAHIGFTPQAVNQLGGYRVQGRLEAEAERLYLEAAALESAGAAMIVLEMVPRAVAKEVTRRTDEMITIGIGAAPECHGQVLVLYDVLDIFPGRKARFVQNFLAGAESIHAAVAAYVNAVKSGAFPTEAHCY